MFFTVLIILVGAGALVCTVLLLSPVTFRYVADEKTVTTGILHLVILHPLFLRITHAVNGESVDIQLFGRFQFGASKNDGPSETPASEQNARVYGGSGQETGEEPGSAGTVHEDAAFVADEEKQTTVFAHETESVSRGSREENYHIPSSATRGVPGAQKKKKKQKLPAEENGVSEKGEKKAQPSPWRTFKTWVGFVVAQKRIALKMLGWLRRIISSCFRIITFDELSLDCAAGFSDPALTGALYGYYTGMFHGFDMEANRTFKLAFQPLFENRDVCRVRGAVACKTSLAQLLRPVAVALVTFPYVSALLLWWRYRRFNKRMNVKEEV